MTTRQASADSWPLYLGLRPVVRARADKAFALLEANPLASPVDLLHCHRTLCSAGRWCAAALIFVMGTVARMQMIAYDL